MLKKVFLLLFALALASVLGCAAGQGDPGNGDEEDWKIGIMSSPVTQNEEEYRIAEHLVERYGADRILHATFPDRFMDDQETIVTNMLELASTPGMRAIIMVQAVPGAAAAVDKVREQYPDILFLLGSPQEDPGAIARTADIILDSDDIKRGDLIVEHAAAIGAEVVVHYSFPRHLAVPMLAERRRAMKERAEELGLLFIDEDVPDPVGEGGVPGAHRFITEDVPLKISQYGKNTLFFGTNSAMVEPLIRATAEAGGISPGLYSLSSYPSLPEALGIEIPGDREGDVPWLLEQINQKLAEAGAPGLLPAWTVPLNMLYLEAGVEYAIAWINGNTGGRVDKAKLAEIMQDITADPVNLSEYPGIVNYFLYSPGSIIFSTRL